MNLVTFAFLLKNMTLPRDIIHSPSMETDEVVAFCHGFKITDEFFLHREIGLCSRDGYHHLLLSYSPGRDLSAFSNETQMSIDEQMKYDHGLTFDNTSGRDQNLVAADAKQWYKTHCPSDFPAVGLLDVTPPLKELFQAMDIPTVDLPIGLNEIHELPIGTTNVMSPSDLYIGVKIIVMASFPFGMIIVPVSCCVSSVGGYAKPCTFNPWSKKSMLSVFGGKNVVTNCWNVFYVTIAFKEKIMLLPRG